MTIHRAITKTAAEVELAAQFASLASPEADRVEAFAAFSRQGLPTRRNEAWHYTDLRSVMGSAAPLAPAPGVGEIEAAQKLLGARSQVGDVRFVMVNGRFAPEISDRAPEGLTISDDVERSSAALDAVIALNDAFAPPSLSLTIEEGVQVAERIEIVHCGSSPAAQSLYSKVGVTLRAGARARVGESFLGADAGCQRNALTEISIGANAACAFASLVDDSSGQHLETQIVKLEAGAEFNAFALVAGGALVRRQIFAGLFGRDAKIALGGLNLLDRNRHADTTLVVEHAAPHGRSREYYKHIVADSATSVYQGKVIVQPHAQKTDGGMKSQAILLSPSATMMNKPELEIFADDVVCGHGATVGALDPEQIFYAMARGIPRGQAEAMLLEAFGADAILRVDDAEIVEVLLERMRAWAQSSIGRKEAGT
jgi:Fe-S cluster assembly protein SufD